MFACRYATLILAGMLFLTLSSTHAPSGHRDDKSHSLQIDAAFRLQAAVATVALPRRLASPRVTFHSPWKSRRKAVLEQTDPTQVDERDLGPASVPKGRDRLALIERPPSRLPSDPPLRC